MRENRTSGSMRGCWGLDTVGLVRHRQTKGAETARRDLPSGFQALLYPSVVHVTENAKAALHFCRSFPFGEDPTRHHLDHGGTFGSHHSRE